MSKSIETMRIGDEKRVRIILTSGTYQLDGKDEFIVLKRPASIETTQRWAYRYQSIRENAEWKIIRHHMDTLEVLPTTWERIVAFFWRRPQPLPRAVLVNTRKP